MSVVLGKNVKIYGGGSSNAPIIAMAKSCTVNRKCELIERAPILGNGTAKEYVAGREEWEVSLGHLVVDSAPFEGILMVRNTYTIRIEIDGQTKTGTAICTQAELSAPVKSLATGSVKFKGTGPLT